MAQANFKIRGGIHVAQHCVNRFKERSNYKQLKRMNGQDIRSKIRQLLKEGHDMDVPQITKEGQRIVKVSYLDANNIPMTLCVILNPAIASKFEWLAVSIITEEMVANSIFRNSDDPTTFTEND